MSKEYAELTLYFGLVDSNGVCEGRLCFDKSPEGNNYRYFRAMNTVLESLDPSNWFYGVQIGGWDPFVRSEEEAKTLVEYAERNIEGSQTVIELEDSMHGSIRFFRKIRFPGFTKDQKDGLIELLKRSGYEPVNREREIFEGEIKQFENKEIIATYKKRIEELKDAPWHQALRFYK